MGGFANNAPIVTEGLVFYVDAGNSKSYPGSGTTWTDLVGGNDGTLANGPTFDSGNGGSIVFDGVDDWISTPDLGSLNEFTVDCWFYPTANPGNSAAIITSVYTGGRKINFIVGWGNSEVATNTFFGGYYYGSWVKTSGITAVLNQWWNLTLTYSNNKLKFYSSASLYSTTNNTNVPISGNNGIRIGRRWDLPEYFQGEIPNIKIYNRALTSTEILQNYNALKNRFV